MYVLRESEEKEAKTENQLGYRDGRIFFRFGGLLFLCIREGRSPPLLLSSFSFSFLHDHSFYKRESLLIYKREHYHHTLLLILTRESTYSTRNHTTPHYTTYTTKTIHHGCRRILRKSHLYLIIIIINPKSNQHFTVRSHLPDHWLRHHGHHQRHRQHAHRDH